MTQLDKRFALLRGNEPWYAAAITERGAASPTFRISTPGESRDAHGLAEQLTDVETVARRVLLEGKRMRCQPEGGKASSLSLASKDVTGYRLDAGLAATLGVKTEGGRR